MNFVQYRDFYRNVRGRYDLLCFLYKWDSDYKKDLIVTGLTILSLTYAAFSLNSPFDIVALILDAAVVAVQMRGDMSILPVDYRPSHGGVRYTAQVSRHIAYDELSFWISDVAPSREEEAIGFYNPFPNRAMSPETSFVSEKVDDAIMLRAHIPFYQDPEETNYIRSRHQLRYLAIRVADKKSHTTNSDKAVLFDTATAFLSDQPIVVRKSFYFDGLLTSEAFRSRIFRNNINGEKEVYTDLTTYFPVQSEIRMGEDALRFRPGFYKRASGHIGITTILITENNRVAMMRQGDGKAVGSGTVSLGGSGSMGYDDLDVSLSGGCLKKAVVRSMARELAEETGLMSRFDAIHQGTKLTGFFRWVDRCGKPEFVGVTRVRGINFSKDKTIDGDEVVGFEEIPVTINRPDDFHAVLAYVRDNKINLALSSLMALYRLSVIGRYSAPGMTADKKKIYDEIAAMLA